jgi:molybdopterin molybdotransferase
MRRLQDEAVLSFGEAERIVAESTPLLETEEIELADSLGRVLAEDIIAPGPIPHFDASMVDGFAVRSVDVAGASASSPVELRIESEIPAGGSGGHSIAPGGCARIFTGSALPPGADAVVMLEWTEWDEDRVRTLRPAAPGQHVRRAGEDIQAGDVVLQRGDVLRPQGSGALASMGFARVSVSRRPHVAILMTGDELLSPTESLSPGKIRSSNHLTLAGQVREAGGVVIDLGTARDDPQEIERMLNRGNDADVVITSGGVSVGDHDHVKRVFERLGVRRLLWRVAASPGKPVFFGKWGQALVFGLPGNPVSSMISFECFVRPALRRMQRDRRPLRPRLRARLDTPIRGAGERRHFARVRVRCSGESFLASEVGPKGSGNLRSMVHANALAVIPEGTDVLPPGSIVDVMLLEGREWEG